MKKKILIHQFKNFIMLPSEIRCYWIEYISSPPNNNSIFNINGNEVLVRVNDYLILEGKKLYYYPKEVWECRKNKNIVGRI